MGPVGNAAGILLIVAGCLFIPAFGLGLGTMGEEMQADYEGRPHSKMVRFANEFMMHVVDLLIMSGVLLAFEILAR
jgi:hypothetical protein